MYTERERLRRTAIKVSLYMILVLLAFAAQSLTPKLPVWDVRPQLLIVASAVIAMFAGPFLGGAAGFLCGFICDWISVYTVTYYTVMLMLLGIALGVVAEHSMRRTLLAAYFIAIITLTITQGLYVALFLLLARRASLWAYVAVTTPELLYSLVLLPLLYFPARSVYRLTLVK